MDNNYPPIPPQVPPTNAPQAPNPWQTPEQPIQPAEPPIQPEQSNPWQTAEPPAPQPYQPEPQPYQPAPQQYQPEPQQYQPEPQQYQPEPQQYQPEPQPYQPEPQPYQPEPQQYQPELQQYQAEQPEPQPYQPEQQGYQPGMPPTPPIAPPAKRKGKGLMWALIALGIIVVAGLGVGAYFFLLRDKTPENVYDDEWDRNGYEEDADNDEGMVADESDDDAYAIQDEDLTTPDHQVADNTEPVAAQPVASGTRSIIMSGDADGYPLTLELNIEANGNVSGTYKNEQGTTLNVSGTESNGVISLRGRSNSGSFSFRIVPDGHIYTGTFSKGGKNRELHLTARQREG